MPQEPDPEEGNEPSPTDADDLDEVGFVIGPDVGGGGLFDRTGTDGTGSGEHTASTLREDPREPPRRTALLAWLAADLPAPPSGDQADVTHPGALPGPPDAETLARLRAALRRELADEAPDPLPTLDAVAGRLPPPPAEVGAAPGEAAPAPVLAADNEETATTLPRPSLLEDPSDTAPIPAEVLVAIGTGPRLGALSRPPAPRLPASPASGGATAAARPSAPPRPDRAPPIPGLAPLIVLVVGALALAYFFFGGR